MREVDSMFLDKAVMIVSGLRGDSFQITKKDWNEIRRAVIQKT